jgi:hypothetical protein
MASSALLSIDRWLALADEVLAEQPPPFDLESDPADSLPVGAGPLFFDLGVSSIIQLGAPLAQTFVDRRLEVGGERVAQTGHGPSDSLNDT